MVPDIQGVGSATRSASGTDREEVTVAIEETIQQLTERLVTANAREAARIRTRIQELEKLHEKHDHL